LVLAAVGVTKKLVPEIQNSIAAMKLEYELLSESLVLLTGPEQ
jgi:hypothetical protein